MIFRIAFAALAAAFLLGSPDRAEAQGFGPYNQYSSNIFFNSHVKETFDRQWAIARMRAAGKHETANALEGGSSGSRQSAGSRGASAAQVEVPLSMSSFRPAGAPTMHKRVAASIEGMDAKQRQELEGTLQELLKAYDRLLEENNEQRLKNNIAGAFNFLFTASYYALKDGRELTGAQQESMLKQVNTAIALSLKERSMSDREKQDLYESAALAGMLVLGLYNEGRDEGRPEQMKTAAEMAGELLEGMMGISIDKVRVSGSTVQIR